MLIRHRTLSCISSTSNTGSYSLPQYLEVEATGLEVLSQPWSLRPAWTTCNEGREMVARKTKRKGGRKNPIPRFKEEATAESQVLN